MGNVIDYHSIRANGGSLRRNEMAQKIHLRQTVKGRTACSVRLARSDGKIVFNSRDTYRNMGAVAVSPDEFRETVPENRCAHCCDRFTPMMNARRARAGKPLYKDAMTKELME